jgi:leucyl-tRNA synthetase
LLIILSPYAPHITEELYHQLYPELGNKSIQSVEWPKYEEKYLIENTFEYPISVNGKLRHKMVFDLSLPTSDLEKEVLAAAEVQKWTGGKPPKKVIVVQGKIVNIVI